MSKTDWKQDFEKGSGILDRVKEIIEKIRKPELVSGYSYEKYGKEIEVDQYRRKKRKKKTKIKIF